MWIFTEFGFFSAVALNNNDKNTFKVRARDKQHLQNLKNNFVELAALPIIEDAGTDYPYRLIMPKATWVAVMTGLAERIDYTNFKSAVYAREKRSPYETALHTIWGVMRSITSGTSSGKWRR